VMIASITNPHQFSKRINGFGYYWVSCVLYFS
jgi:hypothetical protein